MSLRLITPPKPAKDKRYKIEVNGEELDWLLGALCVLRTYVMPSIREFPGTYNGLREVLEGGLEPYKHGHLPSNEDLDKLSEALDFAEEKA